MRPRSSGYGISGRFLRQVTRKHAHRVTAVLNSDRLRNLNHELRWSLKNSVTLLSDFRVGTPKHPKAHFGTHFEPFWSPQMSFWRHFCPHRYHFEPFWSPQMSFWRHFCHHRGHFGAHRCRTDVILAAFLPPQRKILEPTDAIQIPTEAILAPRLAGV